MGLFTLKELEKSTQIMRKHGVGLDTSIFHVFSRSRALRAKVDIGTTQLVDINASATGLACRGSSPSNDFLNGRLSLDQSFVNIRC